jgi:hypothetical protein
MNRKVEKHGAKRTMREPCGIARSLCRATAVKAHQLGNSLKEPRQGSGAAEGSATDDNETSRTPVRARNYHGYQVPAGSNGRDVLAR